MPYTFFQKSIFSLKISSSVSSAKCTEADEGNIMQFYVRQRWVDKMQSTFFARFLRAQMTLSNIDSYAMK